MKNILITIILILQLVVVNLAYANKEESLSLNEKGVNIMQAGDTKKAEDVFKKALELDSHNVTAAYNLSAALVSNKKETEAKNILNSYVKQNPNDLLLQIRLGDIYFSLRNLKKAKEVYERVLEKDKDQNNLYTKLGTIYALLKNTKKAEYYYKNAAKLDPDNPDLISSLASIQLSNGKTQESIQSSKRAIQLKPSSGTYITLGSAYESAGDIEKALIAYNSAKKLDNKSENLENKINSLSKIK